MIPLKERCARCGRYLRDEEIAGYTGRVGAPDRKVWCEPCLAQIAKVPK